MKSIDGLVLNMGLFICFMLFLLVIQNAVTREEYIYSITSDGHLARANTATGEVTYRITKEEIDASIHQIKSLVKYNDAVDRDWGKEDIRQYEEMKSREWFPRYDTRGFVDFGTNLDVPYLIQQIRENTDDIRKIMESK